MHDEEAALIKAFVSQNKQERYLDFVANAKRRKKFVQALYHFNDFDRSYEVAIPRNQRTPEEIARLLKSRGAPETCYAISTNKAIDQKRIALSEVLQSIVDGSDGTLLSCIPGRLAYFEGESPGECFILERANGPRNSSL